jgi:hypothetical protein
MDMILDGQPASAVLVGGGIVLFEVDSCKLYTFPIFCDLIVFA